MSNSISMITIAVRLTIICIVNVVLLIIINFITLPIIEKNKQKTEIETNKFLMKDGNRFNKKKFKSILEKEKNDYYYFEVYDSAENLIGYIATSFANGYGGKLKVMVAFDRELKILGVKALENNETPGIGKKMENQEYMEKFINTNTLEKPIPYKKDMLTQKDADSITGATITFKAVSKAIQKAGELLKDELNN